MTNHRRLEIVQWRRDPAHTSHPAQPEPADPNHRHRTLAQLHWARRARAARRRIADRYAAIGDRMADLAQTIANNRAQLDAWVNAQPTWPPRKASLDAARLVVGIPDRP